MSSSVVLTSAKKKKKKIQAFLRKINWAMCYSKLLTDDPGFSEKSSEGNLFLKTIHSTGKEKGFVRNILYEIEQP